MQINCTYDELLNLDELKERVNTTNTNIHDSDQVKSLAKAMKFYGVRLPIILSIQTGKIADGHCRLLAADLNGWTQFPVLYQDFKDDDEERGFQIAINALQQRSNVDWKLVNELIPEFNFDFDIDHLGLKSFSLDPSEKKPKLCEKCKAQLK